MSLVNIVLVLVLVVVVVVSGRNSARFKGCEIS
jgi:hypothetical protein